MQSRCWLLLELLQHQVAADALFDDDVGDKRSQDFACINAKAAASLAEKVRGRPILPRIIAGAASNVLPVTAGTVTKTSPANEFLKYMPIIVLKILVIIVLEPNKLPVFPNTI